MSYQIISHQTKINQATLLKQSMVVIKIDDTCYTLVFHQDSLLAFGRTKNNDSHDNNTLQCPIMNSQIHTFFVEGMNRIIRKAEKSVPDRNNQISSSGITEAILSMDKNVVLKMLEQQRKAILIKLSHQTLSVKS